MARLLTDLRLEDKRFFINAKLEREKRERLISLPRFSGRFEAREGMFRGERVLRRGFLLGEKAQEALVLTCLSIFWFESKVGSTISSSQFSSTSFAL
ncbi:MAG TPA: hypothetical protein VIE89_06245 [Candidatus Binatia bacterium]